MYACSLGKINSIASTCLPKSWINLIFKLLKQIKCCFIIPVTWTIKVKPLTVYRFYVGYFTLLVPQSWQRSYIEMFNNNTVYTRGDQNVLWKMR